MVRRLSVGVNRAFAAWERYQTGKDNMCKVHEEKDFKEHLEILEYNPKEYITHSSEIAIETMIEIFIVSHLRKGNYEPPTLNSYVVGDINWRFRFIPPHLIKEAIEYNKFKATSFRHIYPRGIGVRIR